MSAFYVIEDHPVHIPYRVRVTERGYLARVHDDAEGVDGVERFLHVPG